MKEDRTEWQAAPKQEDRTAQFREMIAGEYREAFEAAVRERLTHCMDGRLAGGEARQAQLRERFERLQRQFDGVRAQFPQAELSEELDDPVFMRMIARGLEAREAYELAHFDELQQDAMAYGARRMREELSAAMQAGYLRPREGGMTPSNGGVFAEDVEHWSRETRDELKTRARRGEKVRL